MKLKSLLSLAAVALLAGSVALLADGPTGKIHGKVIDPTGTPKTVGTVSLSTDNGKTLKYNFPLTPTGEYTGDGIAPGTYTLIYRQPDTPEGKIVDHIDNVKIVAGQDVAQDDDLSREEYLKTMTPEQRKQVEDFKKKNAEVTKTNLVIKVMNADLAAARAANHDKKYDEAETLMLKDTAAMPTGELLWYELGLAQLGEKKYDDATVSLKKTVDLATTAKKPNPELIGGAQAALGEVYARNNKPDDAGAQFDAAAKSNPAKAATYYQNEAVIYFNTGNADAQTVAADKAIAADPKNPLPYYLKGQSLAGKITVDPKSGAYIVPPGCVEAYKKYIELAPTGTYAAESKAIIDETQTKVETKYKAKGK